MSEDLNIFSGFRRCLLGIIWFLLIFLCVARVFSMVDAVIKSPDVVVVVGLGIPVCF